MKQVLFAAGIAILGVIPVAQAGDAEAGRTVFKRCAACHMATEPTNKVGPHLVGVVGRPAGKVEGYRYSANLLELAEAGLTWDEPTLAAYLAKPRAVIPKGTMAFAGLPKPKDVEDVIAYLKADPKP